MIVGSLRKSVHSMADNERGKSVQFSIGKMKGRKMFIGLTFKSWNSSRCWANPLKVIGIRDSGGASSTQTDNVLGLRWGRGFGKGGGEDMFSSNILWLAE